MSIDLFNQIVVIFLLAGVGYIARRANILNAQLQTGLSAIVLNIAIPCSIIASAAKPLDKKNFGTIGIILLGAALYYVVAILFMTGLVKLLRIEKKQAAITTLLVVFANAAFIGLPVVSIFLPENGVFFASFFVLVFNICFFSYATWRTAGNSRIKPLAILGNINNIASVVMIALYLLQIKMPIPIQKTLELFGGLSTPLSMLVIGGMLGTIKLRQLFATPLLYLTSFLRLVFFPVVTFFVLKALGITAPAAIVLLVLVGLPSGSMTVMLAERDNFAPEFATKGVLLSTILFMASVPLLAFLVGQF